jgi:N-acetylglucosaminyl-diphospho-decaprenol L-rhamnosyltransferase
VARAPSDLPSAAPRIAIVIVTWNSSQVLASCLDAIAAHPPSAPFGVVVVDNGSTDATVAVAREHPVGAEVIANPGNRGLAAANNQGILAGSADYVLLANPDTEVTEGAIDGLVAALERHRRAVFAIPRLRYPDGRPQASAGDLPTLSGALLGRQAHGLLRRGSGGFWWDEWAHDEERRIGRGHESCYLVRRSALDEIGLQDEGFVLDWEGIDWAARAAAAGWETWFTPEAEVIHVGGASIRQAPVRWIVGSHRGMYRYFAKRTPWPLRPALFAVVLLRGLAKAVGAVVGPATYARSHQR